MSKPVMATKNMLGHLRGSGSFSRPSSMAHERPGAPDAPAHPTTPRKDKFDGDPPMGYLWLWMGGFMRWRRRFIVAGEAPGVVLIYKRMNMKGKIWSISLSKSSVHEDESDIRQLKIVTTAGLIFLRTNTQEQRDLWLECLSESIALYLEKQHLVAGLQEQGLLPKEGMLAINSAMVAVAAASHRAAAPSDYSEDEADYCGVSADAPISSLAQLKLKTEVADMDVEQRRRIRQRVGEGLAHLSHYQLEVEQQLNAQSANLLSVVTSLNVRVGTLTANSASMRVSHVVANTASRPGGGSPPLGGSPTGGPSRGPSVTGGGADAHAPPGDHPSPFNTRGSASALQQQLPPSFSHAATPLLQPSMRRGASFVSAPVQPGNRPANLQQAYAQMLEAFRQVLHGEAVRIAQVEAENCALRKSVQMMQASAGRRERDARGGTAAAAAAAAGGGATAAGTAAAAGRSSEDEEEEACSDDEMMSVMTADEDAFDVDLGVGEGGETGDGELDTGDRELMDIHHIHGSNTRESGDDESDDDDEEIRQEDEVLQALEVVRQVQYVEEHSSILAIVASEAPPAHAAPPVAGSDESEEEDESEDERPSGAATQGEGGMRGRRARLPGAKPLGRGFSVWSILKNMIGKDLTRITMPATINEPLDFLQRLAETFEYGTLVDAAARATDSTERMMLVAVWQLSCYNSQPLREGKPFNPLLGETYEWTAPDGSIKYMCEQVSHHPPVSAYHTIGGEGGDSPSPWEVQGEFEVKTKFWGKSIELIMEGCEALKLHKHNEEYRWNKGTICVNDLIFGNYWTEVYGKVKIACKASGDKCVLTLKPCRGNLAKRGEFEGVVTNAKGKDVYKLSGSTMDKVYAALTPEAAKERGATTDPVLMWTKDPVPKDSEIQYNFTNFAIGMNDPDEPTLPYLPPSDARFRPDQRALELGEFTRATTEKLRLEEKQRVSRRVLKEEGKPYEPLWFKQQDGYDHHKAAFEGYKGKARPLVRAMDEEGFVWGFGGKYWEARSAKAWHGVPDLYS
ncbi:hypothetical protein FOA52_002459 [Chlamydomonas sp. UWO 241]|nr:hypothetical protein FOA52_002459 [Chlamydomonas sp. UWO 241]